MSCQKSKHIISMDTLTGEWQWALALLKEMALGSFYDVISFNSPLATGSRYFTADSVSAEISCHSAYQSIEGFLIKLLGKEIWQSTFEVKVASLSHYLQVFVTILSAASFGFRIRYLRCYQRHLEESARGEHEFGQLKRHNTWVHLPMMSQICVGFFHHKVMTMFFRKSSDFILGLRIQVGEIGVGSFFQIFPWSQISRSLFWTQVLCESCVRTTY